MTKQEFNDFFSYIRKKIKGTQYENHVFFVGGCVRDFLMGEDYIKDIDIAVDLPNGGVTFSEWITQKEKCYAMNFNPVIFHRYGTAKFNLSTTQFKNLIVECVQTRKNPSYSISNTAPISQNLGSILDDAGLRDLTINSIFLDVSAGEIIDPKNGVSDISDNVLKTPDYPDIIFRDDPLRMLRIIRFSSKYQWGIEKETWFGILKNHERIKDVSIERVRDELNEILLSSEPSIGLRKLINSGMLYDIIPQLYGLNHIIQSKNGTNKNVWEHTLDTVDRTKPILINRLSALFHDIGKLITGKIIKGKVTFYGHEFSGVSIATDIMTKFKYPDAIIQSVCCVIKNHMKFSMVQGTYTPSRKLLRKFLTDTSDNKDLVLDIIRADFMAHNVSNILFFNRLKELLEEVSEETDYSHLILPVSGKDIMDYLDLRGGPVIGKLLDKIRDAVLENPNLTRQESLELAKKHLALIV